MTQHPTKHNHHKPQHHMSSDSGYSYIHFSHENQAVFMESWRHYDIPHDDIDTAGLFQATALIFPLFLLEDEEDGAIPLNSSVFGTKVNKQRNLLKEPQWTDLSLERLRGASKNRKSDQTVLKSLHSRSTEPAALSSFLSNGYAAGRRSSVLMAENTSDWLNTSSDFPSNNTFSRPAPQLATPLVRRSSEKFGLHTPVPRI